MKKIIKILMSLVMMMTLCSCGDNTDNNGEGNANSDHNSMVNTDDNKNETTQKNEDLPIEYHVPLKKIYVNVPNWQEISLGYTMMYAVGRDYNVTFTACKKDEASSIQDAHEKVINMYKMCMENEALIDELVVDKDKTETINGIEVYRYEGSLTCHDYTGNYSVYAVGYSFIMDGIPCGIQGMVLEENQPQDMIDEVRNTVDAMIKTLRSEK